MRIIATRHLAGPGADLDGDPLSSAQRLGAGGHLDAVAGWCRRKVRPLSDTIGCEYVDCH